MIKSIFTQNYTKKKLLLTDKLNDYYFRIDNNTYNDLILDGFNQEYNNTITSYGDALFDHWTKTIKTKEQIEQIQSDTRELGDLKDRSLIERSLKRIGKQHRGDIISDLWEGFKVDSFLIKNILLLMTTLISLTILGIILFPQAGIFIFSGYIAISLFIYTQTNSSISNFSGSINYFLSAIFIIEKFKKKSCNVLSITTPNIDKFRKLKWSTLLFKDGFTSSNRENPFAILLDYFRVFLCLEAISFNLTAKFMLNNIEDIRSIIHYVAYYDCINNSCNIINSYDVCYANILDYRQINFKKLTHPLLTNPVPQSNLINDGLLITGLNMAGKSTFMRSVALNQLLATSFGFAFSEAFNTNIFKIVTSLKINDSLLLGKSRYFAEAERLSSILSLVSTDRYLCFIDEILSGTNSKDRIYGSIEILKRLKNSKKSIVVCATQDIEIAENLQGVYKTGYFDGIIDNDTIKFDYLLKNGIVSDRNGLLILKALGVNI